jgi:hypothetical protein
VHDRTRPGNHDGHLGAVPGYSSEQRYPGSPWDALQSRRVGYAAAPVSATIPGTLRLHAVDSARNGQEIMPAFRPYLDKPVTVSYCLVPAHVLEQGDELAACADASIRVAERRAPRTALGGSIIPHVRTESGNPQNCRLTDTWLHLRC